jgi:hypothetical protein
MQNFVVPVNHRKRKRNTIMAFVMFVLALVVLIIDLTYPEKNRLGIFHAILPLFVIFNCIDTLRKKKPLFVQISEECIRWLAHEKSTTEYAISWPEIKWIKKEQDGGLTIFRESSFSNHVSLQKFTPEDQQTITQLVQTIADGKKVRLVNF